MADLVVEVLPGEDVVLVTAGGAGDDGGIIGVRLGAFEHVLSVADAALWEEFGAENIVGVFEGAIAFIPDKLREVPCEAVELGDVLDRPFMQILVALAWCFAF